MTDKTVFMLDCYRFGADATLTTVTGTTCPCRKTSGSSREYHRLNPSAADCLGTGQIDTTITETTIKGFFTNRLQSLMTFLNQYKNTEIGEMYDADLFIFGVAKASDASFMDLSGYTESNTNRANKITYQGNDYLIRHVYSVGFTEEVGQVGLLKRVALTA